MSRRARFRRAVSSAVATALLALPAGAVAPPDLGATAGRVVPFEGLVDEGGRSLAALAAQAEARGDRRAWLVSPFYARCPRSCSPITKSLQAALAGGGMSKAGYRVVSLSFDPAETAEHLAAFRANLKLPEEWLTARAVDMAALGATLRGLDFRTFTRDDGGFDHPNVVIVLTADRRVAGYVLGIDVSDTELAALVRRAAAGETATSGPVPGLLVVAAIGLALSVGAFVALLGRRLARRRRAAPGSVQRPADTGHGGSARSSFDKA